MRNLYTPMRYSQFSRDAERGSWYGREPLLHLGEVAVRVGGTWFFHRDSEYKLGVPAGASVSTKTYVPFTGHPLLNGKLHPPEFGGNVVSHEVEAGPLLPSRPQGRP